MDQKAGDVLKCIHSFETPKGCGGSDYCKKCVIRSSVNDLYKKQSTTRREAAIDTEENGSVKRIHVMVTVGSMEVNAKKYAVIHIEDISELVKITELIPICMRCKKIRNDRNYWESVEKYIQKNMNVDLTHGLCEECLEKYYNVNI